MVMTYHAMVMCGGYRHRGGEDDVMVTSLQEEDDGHRHGDDMSCDGDGDVMAMSLQEEDGYTGLHHAAKQGNLQLVHLLLETGQVDINAQVRWETVSVATTRLQTAASGFPISRVDQLAINSF